MKHPLQPFEVDEHRTVRVDQDYLSGYRAFHLIAFGAINFISWMCMFA